MKSCPSLEIEREREREMANLYLEQSMAEEIGKLRWVPQYLGRASIREGISGGFVPITLASMH